MLWQCFVFVCVCVCVCVCAGHSRIFLRVPDILACGIYSDHSSICPMCFDRPGVSCVFWQLKSVLRVLVSVMSLRYVLTIAAFVLCTLVFGGVDFKLSGHCDVSVVSSSHSGVYLMCSGLWGCWF